MSHFAVLVVGNDHEKQLAPYHEFESTGTNDEYVEDVDITDEIRELMAEDCADEDDPFMEALAYHGLEARIVQDESEVDRDGDHKFGYAVVLDGQLIKAVNRTNPDRRWDWYQVGGRWTGFFRLKPGHSGVVGSPGLMTPQPGAGTADQVRKGDVDWEGMRNAAGTAAGELWDRVRSLAPMMWTSWEDVHANFGEDVDEARNFYHSQPGRQMLRSSGDQGMIWVEDSVLVDRDTFVRQARDAAATTFAVVRDGEWYESGEMGCWGIVSNEGDRDDWNARFAEMLDGLPDDTLLTIVDCHI